MTVHCKLEAGGTQECKICMNRGQQISAQEPTISECGVWIKFTKIIEENRAKQVVRLQSTKQTMPRGLSQLILISLKLS